MGEFGRQAIESLSRTGTVGEICSVFYDKNGREVKTDFSDRLIGVGLDTLRNLNYSIGMAASREKVPAIMGACVCYRKNIVASKIFATIKALADFAFSQSFSGTFGRTMFTVFTDNVRKDFAAHGTRLDFLPLEKLADTFL